MLPESASPGSRYVETSGQVPTVCDVSGNGGDGLALKDTTACRASIRAVDGGNVNGGKLVPYYCEIGATTGAGWQEGPSTGVCTLESASRADGGANRAQQMCEWTVSNPFGRVAVAAYGITGADGGTGNGIGADGGYNVGPVVRLECTVPSAGTPVGGTP